jgi:hypothetical protein
MSIFRSFILVVIACYGLLLKVSAQDISKWLTHFQRYKSATAAVHWPGFNDKPLFGPLIYHDTNATYVIGANEALLQKLIIKGESRLSGALVFQQLDMPVDTSSFQMQVDYDETDSSLLHFKNPVAHVSCFATAVQMVPKIQQVEEWLGMVLHESFHQYQTSFNAFRNCQNNSQRLMHRDTLLTLRADHPWYDSSIRQEYQSLIRAVETKDPDSTRFYAQQFLDHRQARYTRVNTELGVDIRELEDMLERSEGVARYMEFCLKRTASTMPADQDLQDLTGYYHPEYYRNYDIKSDSFLNSMGKQYVYATGLTLTRLLEKNGIRFKVDMYQDNRSFLYYLGRWLNP